MTNAQKWVSIVLVLFILLLALSKLTDREESSNETNYSEENTSTTEPTSVTPEELIAKNKCQTCHGRDLNGSGMGPSLENLSTNWDKTNLISYLQNPSAFLNSERMKMLSDRYGREMPAVENLTNEELDMLADYLLKLKWE